MVEEKNWKILSRDKNNRRILDILLENRGQKGKKEKEEFLNPSLQPLFDLEIAGLDQAIKRIKKAIEKKEKIMVYSDYDCDGICGTAILWETLNELDGNVLPYIPDRIKEGYGLSKEAIKKLVKEKTKLIITVDHGITAREEVEFANNLGVEVIITDHHQKPQKLPRALAIVHTDQLCGAGVSFKLSLSLWQSFGKELEDILEKLSLAAIATIADMVPLISINRAIVKFGLEKLQKTKRPGLLYILKEASLKERKIGPWEVSHVIVPRLNASGRLENAISSLRLLCTKSLKNARNLSKDLTQINTKRQKLTTYAIDVAKNLVSDEEPFGVVAHEEFHEGIIGLVASKLVEEYYRPMVVIAKKDGISKGSVRSVNGFNVYLALRSCQDLFLDVGGHPMAAGFTIKTEHIEILRSRLNDYASQNLTDDLITKEIVIDCEVSPTDINWPLFDEIKKLEPFGVLNPQPVFLIRNLLIEDLTTVGQDGKHLKLQLSSEDGELSRQFETIGFQMGQVKPFLRPGFLIDLVFTPTEDNWMGEKKFNLKIVDFKIREN